MTVETHEGGPVSAGGGDDPSPAVDAIVLSAFEVDHLCALSGRDTPSVVAATARLLLSGQDVPPVVVQAGLLARGVLVLGDAAGGRAGEGAGAGGTEVVPLVDAGVQRLLEIICAPALMVRVQCQLPNAGAVVHTVYATPEAGIVESSSSAGVSTYRAVHPASVLRFVVAVTGLDGATSPQGPDEGVAGDVGATGDEGVPARGRAELTMGSAVHVGTLVLEGQLDEAVDLLVSGGLDPSTSRRVADSMAHEHRGSYGVTVVHREDGVAVETVLAWTDCRPSGLWQLDQPHASAVWEPGQLVGEAQVEAALNVAVFLSESTADAMVAQIVQALPSGLR